MWTRTSSRTRQHAVTLLHGAVMALGIAVVADPVIAWTGFALAALVAEAQRGRCAPRRQRA